MTQDIRLIDWEFATQAARRLTPAGPSIAPREVAEAVAELRESARRAHGPVAETTRLHTPADAPDALIVDRATWIDVNATSFSHVIDPVVAGALIRSGKPVPPPTMQRIGSKVTGSEVAALLSFMSTKVLGQYELAPGRSADAARLLLIAPNIVQTERELDVVPSDFRLWVCLHEETHRVQFTAVPWMRDHLMSQIRALLDSVEPSLAGDLVERISEAIRGREDTNASMLEVVSTPEQREIIDRVTGLMSLLEGHADVVMDGVGPEVIPSVAAIRRAFNKRRQGAGLVDRTLRRLLGLDAKMAQYRDGAKFVRAVVDAVGMAEFNAVWAEPGNLPGKDEIHDPDAWRRRVLG